MEIIQALSSEGYTELPLQTFSDDIHWARATSILETAPENCPHLYYMPDPNTPTLRWRGVSNKVVDSRD